MKSSKFLDVFYKNNIRYFSGVPDSCLSELINCLMSNKYNKKIKHFIAPNEGIAISLAAGHYLATNQVPCIYLQNSGFGNATDPITNLCSKNVYDIPLFLIIGWRGKPGTKDEPQHIMQGTSILKSLKNFNITYYDSENMTLNKLSKIINETKRKNRITALLVAKNYFEKLNTKFRKKNHIKRSEAINSLLTNLKINYKIVSSTGFNSREILLQNSMKKTAFYLIGAMGHTLGVSLGSLNHDNKTLVCVDGDGSFYMHQGSFALLKKKHKLIYFLLDNSSHESVGIVNIDYKLKSFKDFAKSVGFKKYIKVDRLSQLDKCFKSIKVKNLPIFIHVKTTLETNKNLPRPTHKELQKFKQDFIKE